MNREQRRNLKKATSERRIHSIFAEAFLRLKERGFDGGVICDGDSVMLNLKMIQSHPDYPLLTEAYRSFVEANTETVFTAKVESNLSSGSSIVTLLEDEIGWHFWSGDLIVVNTSHFI